MSKEELEKMVWDLTGVYMISSSTWGTGIDGNICAAALYIAPVPRASVH